MRLIYTLGVLLMTAALFAMLTSCVATPTQPAQTQDLAVVSDDTLLPIIDEMEEEEPHTALTTPLIDTLVGPLSSALTSPEKLFQEAKEVSSQYPERAIRLYLDGLIQQPGNLNARRALADLYLAQGAYLEAATHFEFIWIDQPSAEVAVLLTDALLETGRSLPAAMIAEAGIDAFPNEHRLLSRAVLAFGRLGILDKSFFWLDRLSQVQVVDPQSWLQVAELAESTGEWLIAGRIWSTQLRQTHPQQSLAALQRLEAHALRVSDTLFFPPSGWQLVSEGFLEIETSRFVELMISSTQQTDTMAQERLLDGLPINNLDELNDWLPDRWEMKMLGEESADVMSSLTPEQRQEVSSLIPPPPLRLERTATREPLGSLTQLSLIEPGFLIPMEPHERHIWQGELNGHSVVVSEFSPLGFSSDALIVFLRELMKSVVVLHSESKQG